MAGPDDIERLIARARDEQDPTGWFEQLYAAAQAGDAVVPWDRGGPHPLLEAWAHGREPAREGERALVVGCGLGGDAELVAGLGFETTAFDVSPTAVRAARERHPGSAVRYLAADLLDAPREWRGAFDFVLESLTVQSLPDPPRATAIARVADLVAPDGTLLVIANARDERDGPVDGPPWPLTRAEIDAFAADGLEAVRIEQVGDGDSFTAYRWRAEFRR